MAPNMRPSAPENPPVEWLSEQIDECIQDTKLYYKGVDFYTKFKYKNVTASVGEYVLISNADAAEPDTEEGCEPALILKLYYSHDEDLSDRYRARVRWFSRPTDLPASCFREGYEVEHFSEREVLEDLRPFDDDVSIETFFKKCNVIKSYTSVNVDDKLRNASSKTITFVCRYRLNPIGKRKFSIEPVMDDERIQNELMKTPVSSKKNTPAKTPNSLIKRMNRVSISDQKWSVSNADGTKLLLKRAILTDKNERLSSSGAKGNSTTKKSINKNDINDILLMDVDDTTENDFKPDSAKKVLFADSIKRTPNKKTSFINPASTPKSSIEKDIEQDISTPKSGRRSIRSSKKVVQYTEEEEKTPTKLSTRNRLKKNISDSEDEFNHPEKELRTPKRQSIVVRGTPKRTPVPRRIGELTPTLRARNTVVENTNEINLDKTSLPGREQQFEEILSFVKAKLVGRTSGCMYISGVPGTGKTATVCAALARLQEESQLPNFQLLEVNGMRITEPRQAYVQIYKQLTGKTVAWEQACSLLERRFTNPAPRRTPTVLLVDELDALCTRRQDVLYSIVEWATHSHARLAVLAVANTMDLPERALAARVASRLGLTRLTFPPYTHTQLQLIVATRLANANLSSDAIQLVARKVAAVSGDARRALSLCARAGELGRAEGGAGLQHVERALAEAAAGAAVRAVRHCSPAERLLLRAVATEVERTGSDETTLSRVLMTATTIAAIEGQGYRGSSLAAVPSPAQAVRLCARLAASKLLLLEPRASEPRLLLNISADDVHYATKHLSTAY